ncbi:MAG TPA: hypothetical protein VLE97_05855 [Gaiellaceae bacterium]|nr:hypothetical protein [Gaiellaceae bacterium]
MASAQDIREFRGFLRNATDRQVQGIYEKERRAGRDDYAELAVAEAERRGLFLDETEGDHATMLRFPRWRVEVKVDGNVVKTFQETATTGEAAINKAKHKMRGAVSSADAFRFTAKKLPDDEGAQHATRRRKSPAQLDREIAEALSGAKHGAARTSERPLHATKRGVPGVTKWNMYAGGTGAAEGKHSYDLYVPEGQYTISPYTRRGGRHAGYLLKFAATGGRPRGSHGGLWHDLGSHASPQKAASAAAKHYAGGFE